MMFRTRRLGVLVASLALVLVASACTGGDDAGDAEGDGGAVAAGTSTFEVLLTDFAIQPDLIEAPDGENLEFKVVNNGQSPHTFAVDTGNGVEVTP